MNGAVVWWRSLAAKIALAVAAVTMTVLIPVGFYVDHQAAHDARERLRVETLARLDTASLLFRTFGQLRYDATTDPAIVPLPLREVGANQRASYFDGDAMWAAERVSPDQILALRSGADSLVEQRRELQHSLLEAGAAALLLGGGLGWLAGTRLSRRARRGAAAARLIAASRTGVVATQPGGDEVAALTRAVDQLAASLNARIAREQAFTADAAHELRTPVTALVSAAELLPHDEAGELVRGQVARLRVLVADLLEIARIDASRSADLVAVDAAAAVRAAVRAAVEASPALPVGHTGDGERPFVHVVPEVVVTASAPAWVEQRRLDRILANLLGNAARHGRGPITVTVRGARVIVDDAGPGFPDWLVEDGPRRFAADGPTRGHGLGLSIAAAQASLLGASLEFTHRPPEGDDPGGGRVVVTLAAAPGAEAAGSAKAACDA